MTTASRRWEGDRHAGSQWRVEPSPATGIQILYAVAAAGTTLWTVGDNLALRRSI